MSETGPSNATDCRRAEELLVDYLYGELDPQATAWFDSHLETCTAHAEQVAKLRAVLALVRADTSALPAPDLGARLLAEARRRLAPEPPPVGRRGWLAWGWQPLLAAAAAGLVAVVVGVFVWRELRVEPQAEQRPVRLDGVVTSRAEPAGQSGSTRPGALGKVAGKDVTSPGPPGPVAAPATVADTRESDELDAVDRQRGLLAQERDKKPGRAAARARPYPAATGRSTVAARAERKAGARRDAAGGTGGWQEQLVETTGRHRDEGTQPGAMADHSTTAGIGRATGRVQLPSAGLAAGRTQGAVADEKLRFAPPPPPAQKVPLAAGESTAERPAAAPKPMSLREPPPASGPPAEPVEDYRGAEEAETERQVSGREHRAARRRRRPASKRQAPIAGAATVKKARAVAGGADDEATLTTRAERLLAEGRPRAAARLLESRLDSLAGRRRADALYLLARAWQRLGNCRRQLVASARALEADPAHHLAAPTLLDRASCQVKLGRLDEARKTYRQVERFHPGYAAAAREGLRRLDLLEGER